MKKLGGILALLLVLVSLAGCTGGGSATAEKVLKVGTEATFPPFEFVDEKTKAVVGFDIDLANAIAKELGMKVEIVNMDFGGLIGALNAKQIDMIASGMSITPERQQSVNFSEPYYDASQSIAVKEDNNAINGLDDLKGKTITVQLGTTGADAAREIQGATVKDFNKVNEAFLEVKNGRADAVIIDTPVAKNYVKALGGLKIVGEPFSNDAYGLAFRKDDTELLNKVNAALKKLQDNGEYQKLLQKWFE